MNDSWIQASLTQDQFEKIDCWIYELIKTSGTPDPLKNVDYCVLGKKRNGLNREAIFSPNCFPLLCEIQPEFLTLNTMVISKPARDQIRNDPPTFIYWFGNIHYFFSIFPPHTPQAGE